MKKFFAFLFIFVSIFYFANSVLADDVLKVSIEERPNKYGEKLYGSSNPDRFIKIICLEDSILIEKITVNRGNLNARNTGSTNIYPIKMRYGQKNEFIVIPNDNDSKKLLEAYQNGDGAGIFSALDLMNQEILEVEIITNMGTFSYKDFDTHDFGNYEF